MLLLLLLLWDRNFFKYAHVRQLVGRGAHLSARVKTGLVFVPTERLPDGSYLAKAYRNAADRKADRGGIPVPVVEHTLDDPARVGHRQGHRLVTTRLDPALYPALERVELYHVRREQELAIDEPKTHQPAAGAGVFQEVLGLMLAHYDAGPLRCWPTTMLAHYDAGPLRCWPTTMLAHYVARSARRLHGHRRHARPGQPVAQLQQPLGDRAERADLVPRPPARPGHPHAGDHRVLVHVQPAAEGVHHITGRRRRRRRRHDNLPVRDALPAGGRPTGRTICSTRWRPRGAAHAISGS